MAENITTDLSCTLKVRKRNNKLEQFNIKKIHNAVERAYNSTENVEISLDKLLKSLDTKLLKIIDKYKANNIQEINIEELQTIIEKTLWSVDFQIARNYTVYRAEHKRIRDYVTKKINYINNYKNSFNTADATIDDNSNISGKNIGILNNEIHKSDNIEISRGMVMSKLKELYPDFDAKQYIRDLEHHIIYKHDESSFAGAMAPYCCAISMFPFINNGIKSLNGLSASPKNLDSFCGIYINMIFAIASQFQGAVSTPEVLMYFDYFARKEWGDEYYTKTDVIITTPHTNRTQTILDVIHQKFQLIVYTINQPTGRGGTQAAFVNFSYFDKEFFESMFGDFVFPDMTKPKWESLKWLQQEFMKWFNKERTKCILTFPVESVAMIYKDGEFQDKEMYDFVCEEYAQGHSFFTYISDTADSLSSCCRLKNKVQTKEFSFTNGNISIQTGSKSVITLNLNRIIQDYCKTLQGSAENSFITWSDNTKAGLCEYINNILERVYKYHTAYNELLWNMYNANLLPVYKAKFIDLNKQYLTIGLNGLNQAAEYLGVKCNDNDTYKEFCQMIFSTIKEQNTAHKTTKTTFNTEQVPAESLAIKNYNWDKADGYWVPEDTNLYASYIFKPNDENTSILEKIRLHGKEYIGEYLDGGAAAHLNLEDHLDKEQYGKLLKYAADNGCQYLTFNVPNCECDDCGYISKRPFSVCPKCNSTHVSLYDRIIGYLTKISNWSTGRRIEQKTRKYMKL